jgi:hypothetical protein
MANNSQNCDGGVMDERSRGSKFEGVTSCTGKFEEVTVLDCGRGEQII